MLRGQAGRRQAVGIYTLHFVFMGLSSVWVPARQRRALSQLTWNKLITACASAGNRPCLVGRLDGGWLEKAATDLCSALASTFKTTLSLITINNCLHHAFLRCACHGCCWRVICIMRWCWRGTRGEHGGRVWDSDTVGWEQTVNWRITACTGRVLAGLTGQDIIQGYFASFLSSNIDRWAHMHAPTCTKKKQLFNPVWL